MSRLTVFETTAADRRASQIAQAAIDRLEVFGNATCPLETAVGFFKLCASQSCGKCTPCRIGLARIAEDLDGILAGRQVEGTVEHLMDVCQTLYETADCAIGFQAGRVGLFFADHIREDAASHIGKGICAQPFTPVPCVKGCPSHVDIPGYIACVREGDFAGAVRVIRNDNPFPSACAFVCEHPCEKTCRRGMVDAPVNIRAIKQHAVLQAGAVPAPEALPQTGKAVAVIGGGPSGLTAAYYLALMGHSVTVFEQYDRLGGMMLYGIPRYRLPQDALDYDIDVILSLGIQVKLNTKVGRDISWAQINDGYDAVYISIGAHSASSLGVDYESTAGVRSAVDFLHEASGGRAEDLAGKDVVIVGGGNVAMDAGRTAKRLGARTVTCVYRRRKADMTALPEEVEAAMAEGCEIVELMAPVRVAKGSDHPLELIGQPQMPGLYRGGRPAPAATTAGEAAFPCDVLIEAVGQKIDSSYFEEQGIPINRGRIESDRFAAVGDAGKAFTGGDCATGPTTVIMAIAAGKAAAANIDAFLGFDHKVHDTVDIPDPAFDSKLMRGRVNIRERPAGRRACDFEGVEIALRDEEAHQECERCLRCDHYGMGALRGGRPRKW